MDPTELIPNERWRRTLKPAFDAPTFKALWKFIEQSYREQTIYPPVPNIFRAFSCGAPKDIKVVILGQDPYHGPGQADGLAFSVTRECRQPPSLKNIFKALQNDLDIPPPQHGDLSRWAEQGVMLLNVVLTVESGKAGSHQRKGWEQFTEAIIRIVSAENAGCAFLLWGAAAEKKAALVDESKHLILKSVHPSPLSAYRGFLHCRHFSSANEFLKKIGKEPVLW